MPARLAALYHELATLDRAKLAALYRAHRRIAIAAASAAAAVLIASIWFVASVASQVPDREALRGIGSMAQATTLFDAKDQAAFTIFREQRIDVPLSDVSPRLVQAILAIEDQRFYDHRGVDIVRVGGAALNNVLEGRLAQGGSTITQQLARQSFLTPDKTIRRKLTEIVVAARLERQFTEGRDPRDVSQQGVFRRRALRRRGRIARLLRQARLRGLGGRGRAARRAGQGAVLVRAHRQRRTRESATQRRAPGDARREDDRPLRRTTPPHASRSCSTTACDEARRSVSTSRRKCADSSSSASDGIASIRAD